MWKKSSSSVGNGACVEVDLDWNKSSHSHGNGACAEVAHSGGQVLVRDSKDPDGGILTFSIPDWQEFTEGIKGKI